MTLPQTFNSVHGALTYAFSYVAQHYDAPAMYRTMCGGEGREGKGLHGVDGAGQSGMIRAEIARLKPDAQALIAVKYAPRSWPCECGRSCCSGQARNDEWSDALAHLVARAVPCALAGCVTHYRARRALLIRALAKADALRGVKADTLDEIADSVGQNRSTIMDHNKRMLDWVKVLHDNAEAEIYMRLVGSGVVVLEAA